MSKLTLLLIPLLFFMTSCTIDGNDENIDLKNQLQYLCEITRKNPMEGGFRIYSLKHKACIHVEINSKEYKAIDISSGLEKDKISIPGVCFQDSVQPSDSCSNALNEWKKQLKGE